MSTHGSTRTIFNIQRDIPSMTSRLVSKGLGGSASRMALAIGLAVVVPAALLTQQAAAQVQLGTSFDCSRAGQSIPSLVCHTPELQIADLHQIQAYYILRHAQPERQQELRNQFSARVQGLVRVCSTEQGRGSGSQIDCVARALGELRNFWLEQIQQAGHGAALEEARQPVEHFVGAQHALRAGGFLPADTVLDGVYGSRTRQAIARFQAERGILVDGFLTSATAEALRGVSAPSTSADRTAVPQQQRTASPQQTAQVQQIQRPEVNAPLPATQPAPEQPLTAGQTAQRQAEQDRRAREQQERMIITLRRILSRPRIQGILFTENDEAHILIRTYSNREKNVLEQILNYTTTSHENGIAAIDQSGGSLPHGHFWISGLINEDRCIIHEIQLSMALNQRNERKIALGITQLNIRQFNQDGFRIRGPFGREGPFGSPGIYTIGDERQSILGHGSAVLERLQRAWGLAFQECPGRRSPF